MRERAVPVHRHSTKVPSTISHAAASDVTARAAQWPCTRPAFTASAILLVSLTVFAGTYQLDQPPSAAFHSSVNYVEVNANVFDANGHPLLDLTKDEVEILEDGQPQTIATFQLVRLPAPPHTERVPLDSDVVTN